jgi:hypothetical protein
MARSIPIPVYQLYQQSLLPLVCSVTIATTTLIIATIIAFNLTIIIITVVF